MESTAVRASANAVTWSLALLLVASSPAFAGAIEDWNAIAAKAVTASGRADSCERARVMTMVNTAMFETVNFIEGRHPSRFLVKLRQPEPAARASNEAAAAAAAHYVLSQLYPEQQVAFSVALVRSLQAIPDGEDKVVGQLLGTRLGINLYAILSSDPESAVEVSGR